MAFDFRRTDPSTELVDIIRQVRRRWRMKLALRGALGVIGLGLLVLLLSAWGLEAWRFTPGSIITFRIVLGLSVVGLVAYLLIKPLMQHATDEQVALYLEEHEPSLQAEIISAIDASRQQQTQGPRIPPRWCGGWSSPRSRRSARLRTGAASSARPFAVMPPRSAS